MSSLQAISVDPNVLYPLCQRAHPIGFGVGLRFTLVRCERGNSERRSQGVCAAVRLISNYAASRAYVLPELVHREGNRLATMYTSTATAALHLDFIRPRPL